MDRLIYTSLNSLANLRDTQVVVAQNLANSAVPGFRSDLANEGSAHFLSALESHTSRVFQLERGPHGFSERPGALSRTGDSMDIAIVERGYFYIQPEGGGAPALSRRGDLRTGADGVLTNGAGEVLLGTDLQPVILPPFRSIAIDDLGQITLEPANGAPGERVQVATLATLVPDESLELAKSPDGRIRMADGSALPGPDQMARVTQGALEGSNVDSTGELIASIELQRSFELNMRMIQTARDTDEAALSLLRMPGA